jgi:DNA mismatch repair protein MutL
MDTRRIHILDKAVAERIAAGEVVERPASVVKELVENAIDAGARAIAVEIREGGLALIRVSDNGSGMPRGDATLAVERFATSKIAAAEDLDAVRTLGFRGEALPSMASVSQLELVTRLPDEIEGARVRVVDGQVETEVAGAPVGTQVTVRNLFYNTPARRKFLKSPLRETELIQKTLMTYGLAYPHIAIRLTIDGRPSLLWPAAVGTPGVAPQLERIGAVWGREAAADMVALDYTSVDLRVQGYVSRPTLARSSREWQAFYVNGRPIRSGLLAVMLERPYAGRLPPNRHPLAVIEIEIDPRLVDVNVHPRKAEVRFYQERAIYGVVTQAVEGALRDYPRVGEWMIPADGTTDWSFAEWPEGQAAGLALGEARGDYLAGPWRAVGQIHNTYILAQSGEGLVIVDQHAAQEQVFYERLTTDDRRPTTDDRGRQTADGGRQSSVPRDAEPIIGQIQLMPQEAELVNAQLEEYHALGIEIEPFGAHTFRVTAMPAFIPLNPAELITALVEEQGRQRGLAGEALRDKLAARAACLSAVKAGDVLDPAQQQAILDELVRVYSPATCPHGRPVFLVLGLEELERRFLRR